MTGYTAPRPLLLAEHAHAAATPGACALCPYTMHTGQRIARLATGEWCHAWCVAALIPARSTPENPRRKTRPETRPGI